MLAPTIVPTSIVPSESSLKENKPAETSDDLSLKTTRTLSIRSSSSSSLPDERPYPLSFAGRGLWLAFGAAIVLLAAERVARLSCPSFVMLGLEQGATSILGMSATGWLFARMLGCRSPRLSALAFGIIWGVGVGITVTLGLWRIQTLPGIASVVIWLALRIPRARNKCLGVAACFSLTTVSVLNMTCLNYLPVIKGAIPAQTRGCLAPILVFLFESLTYIVWRYVWVHFYSDGVDIIIYPAICAYIVQTCETLRLIGFISASLAPTNSLFVAEMAVNCVISMASDIVFRTQLVQYLVHWCRHKHNQHFTITPEKDVFLRCRFFFGYTPYPIVISSLATADIMGFTSVGGWKVSVLLLVALAAELGTDACFVVLHRSGNESVLDTLRRLLRPGGHVPLRILSYRNLLVPDSKLAADTEQSGTTKDANEKDAVEGDIECDADTDGVWTLGSSKDQNASVREAWVYDPQADRLSIWCARVMLVFYTMAASDSGITALVGSCGWIIPKALC